MATGNQNPYIAARERQWADVHEAVAAYLAGTTADLDAQLWWAARYNRSWAVDQQLRESLAAGTATYADAETLRLGDATDRPYNDPDVLAEVDMDAAYLRAAAAIVRHVVEGELAQARSAELHVLTDDDAVRVAADRAAAERILAMLPAERD